MALERVALKQWTIPTNEHARQRFWAYVVCPQCGKEGAISKAVHRVEPEGQLQPSFMCPHCPYRAWVKLDGWPASPGQRVVPVKSTESP